MLRRGSAFSSARLDSLRRGASQLEHDVQHTASELTQGSLEGRLAHVRRAPEVRICAGAAKLRSVVHQRVEPFPWVFPVHGFLHKGQDPGVGNLARPGEEEVDENPADVRFYERNGGVESENQK